MLTEYQRELLIRARELLASGREDCICPALRKANGLEINDGYLGLLRYINGQLGTMLYETWMQRNHPELIRHMTPLDFRTGRIEWISWMLAED